MRKFILVAVACLITALVGKAHSQVTNDGYTGTRNNFGNPATAPTNTPVNTPTPGPTKVVPYFNGTSTTNLYDSRSAFSSSYLFFGTSTYDEILGGNAVFKNTTGMWLSKTGLGSGEYIGIDGTNGVAIAENGKDITISTSTSGNIVLSPIGSINANSFIDMGTYPVTNMADPTTANMAATKNYVDTHPGNILSGFVTFTNALTTPVTVAITGATTTSKCTMGENGTAVSSSFGYTPSTNQVIFNGTFAGAATIAYILVP